MSVIAVSSGSLNATRELVDGIRARLGYRVVSREEVIAAAERYGIKDTGLGEKDIMEYYPPGYWYDHSDERTHYLTCFKAALLDFAVQGPLIYHGNMAHLLINEFPFILRVRVNAPLKERIKPLMEEVGISKKAAVEMIKDMDIRRRLWIQFLYDAEVLDPVFFDLVLNLERISIEDAVEMVVGEAQKESFRPDEKSLKALKDLHLASVVKTYLMRSPKTRAINPNVDADSSTGTVMLKGGYSPEAIQTRKAYIRSVLSGVESSNHVKIKVAFG